MQWATLVYNLFKEGLSAEDIALLESYGAVTLDVRELARASMARQYDPLIIDLNENNLYSTTLQDGTYYDYGEGGTYAANGSLALSQYDENGDGMISSDLIFSKLVV